MRKENKEDEYLKKDLYGYYLGNFFLQYKGRNFTSLFRPGKQFGGSNCKSNCKSNGKKNNWQKTPGFQEFKNPICKESKKYLQNHVSSSKNITHTLENLNQEMALARHIGQLATYFNKCRQKPLRLQCVMNNIK